MPSKKTRPLTDAELEAHEATRDLGAELLESIREMKAGKWQVAFSPAIEACPLHMYGPPRSPHGLDGLHRLNR